MTTLSPRTEAVLAALCDYQAEHGYAPSIRELTILCDLPSTSSVVYHLEKLARAGYIERQREQARSIAITDAGRLYDDGTRFLAGQPSAGA